MQKSELRLIKNAREYIPQEKIDIVPRGTRGIYVLYKSRGKKKAKYPFYEHFDFLYIGMATNGIKGRLRKHEGTKKWTHFSFFEVWDNISDEEIRELEGLVEVV